MDKTFFSHCRPHCYTQTPEYQYCLDILGTYNCTVVPGTGIVLFNTEENIHNNDHVDLFHKNGIFGCDNKF